MQINRQEGLISFEEFIMSFNPQYVNNLDNVLLPKLAEEYNELVYRFFVLRERIKQFSEYYPSLLEGNAYNKNQRKFKNYMKSMLKESKPIEISFIPNNNITSATKKISKFGDARKPRKKALCNSQIQEVIKEYKAGAKRNQLAKKYRVSWESINRYINLSSRDTL